MLNPKTYACGICKTVPDQISHHKSHIETQKHKDKRELFEFKLSKLSNVELEKAYKTTNIQDIIMETETIIYISNNKTNLLNDKKKLKQTIFDNVNDMTEEPMSDTQIILKQNFETEMNSVSNKEALKDKIHEIHNYLRNNGAGYGMNALKVFNILYGLKKIEEKQLLDKVKLERPVCEFSYLLNLANQNKDEELAALIFGNVLQSICDSELKELLFYEIPQNIRGSVFVYLIKEINKITIIEKTCNVLLSGKIYEYFIGRDESAISELGAYFTDRHIVDYILHKLQPTINEDGTISTMIDMFGGSGGFTTGYINYLNEKYPESINWETEINKISHFDMNEDVIKSAGLEFFCLTGVLPNMNNLKYKNSFTDEFNEQKYKYPLTNPPYGGDKNSKSEAQSKREKIKEYIKNELLNITDEGLRIKRQKQLKDIEAQEKQDKKESDKTKVCVGSCSARIQKFAKNNELKGNDKESCSLMLLMDILEVGGTAIGVLKEGVFFNKTYKDLRKCLIENFNVREVISVPQDQFENTSTKTSIVIFDNTEEKTSEVKFSDLVVEKYTEDTFAEAFGNIVIVENKDDIKGVSDVLISQATREEILGNPICSLNGKDYNKKEIIVGEDYDLVKLGDICESQNGYAFKTTDYKNTGIPLITITHIKNEKILLNNNNYIEENDKYKKYEIQNDDVIISLTGKKPTLCSIAINNTNEKQYLNQRCALLRNFKKISNYYFACIFNGFMLDYINKYIGNGSNQENVSLTDILNIPIPIPKSQEKIQEWVDKIFLPYNDKNTKQTQIKELETFVKNRIREIGENEECDEVELGSICEINPETLKNKQFTQINYIDIGSVKEEIINNIQIFTDIFPSRAKRIIKKNDILFSTVRPNLKGYTFINNNIENCVASSGFAVIRCKQINPKYIYSLIKDDKIIDYLMLNSTGTKYPAVNPSVFEKIKIKIPKNKLLIQDLESTFQQIETLQHEVKIAEELYKQLIQDLSQEAIPQHQIQPSVAEEPIIAEEQKDEPSEVKISKKKVIKKTDKKVSKKPLIIENDEDEE
jgi:restriction endonuclease S subunit